jgi:hypothetical protein
MLNLWVKWEEAEEEYKMRSSIACALRQIKLER